MPLDDEAKARIIRAVESYEKKQIKRAAGPSRKNEKPEKELVAKPCVAWMRAMGWDVGVFEAKATYDRRRGMYRNQSMRAGTCDCLGNTKEGYAVAVEFKAPGKLPSFWEPRNERQQSFILRKINTGAFACVVDSVETLRMIYGCWAILPGEAERRKFLMSCLPKKKGGV